MKEIELTLTRRRILAGVLVIGLAAAAAGVGTFALFSDDAQSNNSIEAGTLELGAVSGSFNVTGLYPTESTQQSITTQYNAGIDGTLSLNISVTGDSNFASQIDVSSAELLVDGSSVKSFSSVSTLADLEGSYDDVAALSDGDSVTLDANFTLGQDTTNTYQGDSVDITVTFNATQQTS